MPVPTISLIAAASRNGVIGKDNALPWNIPEDLTHFWRTTLGRSVIMGRKTMESILSYKRGVTYGEPLPGRQNIVVTRNREFSAPGCQVAHSLEEAFSLVASQEAFVIGGAELFQQALPYADKVYLTKVGMTIEGDAYFPELDFETWRNIKCTPGYSATFPYPFGFIEYVRRARGKSQE